MERYYTLVLPFANRRRTIEELKLLESMEELNVFSVGKLYCFADHENSGVSVLFFDRWLSWQNVRFTTHEVVNSMLARVAFRFLF